jgi:predicted dehydrogenase
MFVAHLAAFAASLNQAHLQPIGSFAEANEHRVVASFLTVIPSSPGNHATTNAGAIEFGGIIGDAGIVHIQDTFPNLGVVSSDKLHSPDTTYWPEFDGIRGGALREELAYFGSCALKGEAPAIGRPEDALAALQATLAAEESARTGQVIRIEN